MNRTLAVLTPRSGSLRAGAVAAVPSGAGTRVVTLMYLMRHAGGGKRSAQPASFDAVLRCR